MLADPKFGLARSCSAAPDKVLVRSALRHGAFHLPVEAVLGHCLQFVQQRLAMSQADEDAGLSDRALADVRRKLVNIARGIATAEPPAQEVASRNRNPALGWVFVKAQIYLDACRCSAFRRAQYIS